MITRNFKYKYIDGKVIEKTREELEDKEYQQRVIIQNAKQKLNELDDKSIRDIREWVSKQKDASEYIRTYEKEALEERKKISGI